MEFKKEKWMIFRPVVKIVKDYIYISEKEQENLTLKQSDIEKGKSEAIDVNF